jgi:hypothetical protein
MSSAAAKKAWKTRRRNAKKGVAKKRVDKIMEERLRILNPELVSDTEKPLREFLHKKAELKRRGS